MTITIPKENIVNISKGHFELYKCMKFKYENKKQFNRDDLMNIYKTFIMKESDKAHYNYRELTEEQIYNNASSWFRRSIAILVARGYLGLTFEVEVN